MKILHTVEFYHPSVGGAQEVVRQLSRRLAAKDHQVSVATSYLPGRQGSEWEGVEIVPFKISGNLVRGMEGEVERYRKFVLQGGFDIVMNYAAQQWATDALLPLLPEMKAAKVLVPCGFSGLFQPAYHDYFRQMGDWMKQYDACVFLSDNYRDIQFARQQEVQHLHLIPNGAGEDEFTQPPAIDLRKQLGIPNKHLLILTVGSHTGLKGHAEAIEIFKRAHVQNASLLIIGNPIGGWRDGCWRPCKVEALFSSFRPSLRRDLKHIYTRHLERSETLAAFFQADLFLFPSLVECSPLVLFEAMASRTAFLSGDVGNAREIAQWSQGGWIIDTSQDQNGYSRVDIADGATKLERLARDAELRQSLAKSGHEAWQQRFTWKKIAQDYETLYQTLVRAKGVVKT